MSAATEYADAVKKLAPAALLRTDLELKAEVAFNGWATVSCTTYRFSLSPEAAVALGKWLLETYETLAEDVEGKK